MATSYNELLREVKKQIKEITPAEVNEIIEKREAFTILDVRERTEYAEGFIPGARHLSRSFLESRIEGEIPDHNTPLILYCAGGVRSAFATETLLKMGYTNVQSMAGGYGAWKNGGYRFVQPRNLTPAQQSRYSRHISVAEIGEAGQIKLLDAKVLLVGAGGLGSPAAYYLAAAGVGTIGIVDADTVDESNLQRQIIHNMNRIGQSKADSAKQTINDLNPDVNVIVYKERLDVSNVARIIGDYDIILDGTDNFPTRYLLNDYSLLTRKPVVHGSILSFEGQVTTFTPFEGPCYRCLYPEPPPPEMAPNCGEAGVLGLLPGIVGLLQSNEVVKLILGIGETLTGRLLMFDALETTFSELRLRRDPDCPACGPNATLKDLQDLPDYEISCALMAPTHNEKSAKAPILV